MFYELLRQRVIMTLFEHMAPSLTLRYTLYSVDKTFLKKEKINYIVLPLQTIEQYFKICS